MIKNLYKCRQCGADIYFDDVHVSEKAGKKIPLNPETEKPHNCPGQKKYLYCNACKKEIFFDDDYISTSGKKIPLSKSTGNPHRCRAKPFNKDTRRAWWGEQAKTLVCFCLWDGKKGDLSHTSILYY
jgi:hypothetical protein